MSVEPDKKRFDPSSTSHGRPRRPSGGMLPVSDFAGVDPKLRERLKPQALRLAGEMELSLERHRLVVSANWSHKNEGTAETHEHAARIYRGALARLWEKGQIDDDQLAWAEEISTAAEAIERDVAVQVVSYEPRIDCSASAKDALVEGIMRVRREVAYSTWRGWLPHPKRAVLDMIVGDAKPYSTVAREYRIGRQRAKTMLIDALDRWPDAMDRAEAEVDAADIAAMYAGLI